MLNFITLYIIKPENKKVDEQLKYKFYDLIVLNLDVQSLSIAQMFSKIFKYTQKYSNGERGIHSIMGSVVLTQKERN